MMENLDELAEEFRTGLTEEAYRFLRKRGLSDSTIGTAGLGFVHRESSQPFYANSISIPYVSGGGQTIGIRFRYLDPEVRGHKYDSLKGAKLHVYNVKETDADEVWICEGEFDTLILGQLGFAAIGLPGASAFRSEWKWLFSNCEKVSLVMDADTPGRKASSRIASLLGSMPCDLRVVNLPEGKDVTDLYLEDENELRQFLKG